MQAKSLRLQVPRSLDAATSDYLERYDDANTVSDVTASSRLFTLKLIFTV